MTACNDRCHISSVAFVIWNGEAVMRYVLVGGYAVIKQIPELVMNSSENLSGYPVVSKHVSWSGSEVRIIRD